MSKLCLHYTIHLFKLQFSYDYFLKKHCETLFTLHYIIVISRLILITSYLNKHDKCWKIHNIFYIDTYHQNTFYTSISPFMGYGYAGAYTSIPYRRKGNTLDGLTVHYRDSKNLQHRTLSTPDSHPLRLLIQILFARSPHIHPSALLRAHFVFLKTIYNNNNPEVNLQSSSCLTGSFSERKVCLFYWFSGEEILLKTQRPSDPRTSSPCNSSTKLIRCRHRY